MTTVGTTALRARFAAALSDLYGTEVPAYTTLLRTAAEVNRRVVERQGADAERLGTIERVTAERHGAIRVGTPREMAQAARIFGALGMQPVGFYDLRDAQPRPIPVVSTAFRPVDAGELAANPFRVFTSMLVPQDRRFFDADLAGRLTTFLDRRELFAPELLELADVAEAAGGLRAEAAERFLELATAAFALSPEPLDEAWYRELEAVSDVAADIGGIGSTHVNHLTPRVLDIDDLYTSMATRGIEMIDRIEGPPRWDGPDVLLRQTSFRSLAETRLFAGPGGRVHQGALRVRFGEVEARGVALTPAGRDLYDRMTAELDITVARTGVPRDEAARRIWTEQLPGTEQGLHALGLAFFDYTVAPAPPAGQPPTDVVDLVSGGWLELAPVVYEDFLPRSAAGIFASNLTGDGRVGDGQDSAPRDLDWMSAAVGRTVSRPEDLYTAQATASLQRACAQLGIRPTGALPEHWLEPARRLTGSRGGSGHPPP